MHFGCIDPGQWFLQLVNGNSIDSVTTLCERINNFFVSLLSDFVPLSPLDVCDVPLELLATPYETEKALCTIKVKKAPSPDKIPNIILKSFAQELAPVLCDN